MTGTPPEQILCARTADLPPTWLPEAGAIPLHESVLLDTLASISPHWLARPAAENDAAFKQWIPYVLVQDARRQLAVYPRRGTEARLHGLWSVGIGGHINLQDHHAAKVPGDFRHFWQQALWAGLRRELQEEFSAAARGTTRFLGLIHESRTEVGRVHLGAVFLHEVRGNPHPPGPELTDLQWLPRAALGHGDWLPERFELWSRLALGLLPAPRSATCLRRGRQARQAGLADMNTPNPAQSSNSPDLSPNPVL